MCATHDVSRHENAYGWKVQTITCSLTGITIAALNKEAWIQLMMMLNSITFATLSECPMDSKLTPNRVDSECARFGATFTESYDFA